ncbi:MAG: GYD domain-containing protein [Dehalococcoidia bacterium]
METYIMYIGFTEKGLPGIKKLPAEIKTASTILKKAGVKTQGFYAVMGLDRYDGFYIIQAGDGEKVAAAALALASQGFMHTNTLRAFTETEFSRITAL